MAGEGPRPAGFLPGRYPLDAYGAGGFRFADMSHRGSLLCLPSGMRAWSVTSVADFTREAFAPVFAEADAIEILLIGAGEAPTRLSDDLSWAFREAGIGVDAMTTPAAARTYNVLVAERRLVAAALVAVP